MKKGFTLIELIIVIAILAILATVSLNGYNETRKTADISIQTDTLISQLRESRGKSQNTAEPQCQGFQFQIESTIQKSTTPYKDQFTPCDLSSPDTKKTSISDNRLEVTEILITTNSDTEPQTPNELTILYYPPKGDFKVYDNTEPINDFQKIQIATKIDNKENNFYISILNSGVIQKELKEINE